MFKIIFILATSLCLTACGQTKSNKQNNDYADTANNISQTQKMDTSAFWKIVDFGYEKGKFDNKIKQQIILDQLTKLTPEQIQEFEIIFQQMNRKASTWGNYAAQIIIEKGSSDDRFYY